MRIGIFDSGLGGLVVGHAIQQALPEYNYVYLGDTARVPYGDRSQDTIYEFTEQAVDYLFRKEDCALIIIACNTASAEALRRIQQQYLPTHFPDRRVLGVIIPTVESIQQDGTIGVLATRSTIRSDAFLREIHKLYPSRQVIQTAAPLLVPLIENNALEFAEPIIARYTQSFQGATQVILGCTHYGLAQKQIQATLPGVSIITQEEVVPAKLADYLQRHPELEERLGKDSEQRYLVTDLLDHYTDWTRALIGKDLHFEQINLP